MKHSELIEKIERGQLESAYLFLGEEVYLMRQALDKLREKYINPSFETLNYITIDEKTSSFETILNACETLPFMAEKKIVVVNDIEKMLENDDADLSKKLSSYIERLEDHVILILIDRNNGLKKTTSIYKKAKKLQRVVEFGSLKGRDINSWLEAAARDKGKSISTSNINYFLNQSSYSKYGSDKTLYDIENEFLKVIAYSETREIRRENIDMVLVKTVDNNIFDLLKHISSKNSDQALEVFTEMQTLKEPVQKILFMIIRHLRLLLMYKLYRKKGYIGDEARSKMKISPYEFKNIAAQSAGFTEESLIEALDEILKLDVKQKTSSLDDKLALEILIVKLCK